MTVALVPLKVEAIVIIDHFVGNICCSNLLSKMTAIPVSQPNISVIAKDAKLCKVTSLFSNTEQIRLCKYINIGNSLQWTERYLLNLSTDKVNGFS